MTQEDNAIRWSLYNTAVKVFPFFIAVALIVGFIGYSYKDHKLHSAICFAPLMQNDSGFAFIIVSGTLGSKEPAKCGIAMVMDVRGDWSDIVYMNEDSGWVHNSRSATWCYEDDTCNLKRTYYEKIIDKKWK